MRHRSLTATHPERLRVFESDRQLLEDIRIYRKRALLHVSSTLDQLKQIHEDLRRQRKHVFSAAVASPDRDSTLPLEVCDDMCNNL